MMFQNLAYSLRDFADRIMISTVNLTSKTKAFLKEKAIENLDHLAKMDGKEIEHAPHPQIRRELSDFHARLSQMMKTEVKGLHFSKNIPPPFRKFTGKEHGILIALLLAEPLFGNRRKTIQARNTHLERVYGQEIIYEKRLAFSTFKPLKKYKIKYKLVA